MQKGGGRREGTGQHSGGACQVGARGCSGRGLCVASELEEQRCGVQAWRRCAPPQGGLKAAECNSADKVDVLKARLKQLLGAVDDEEADVGAEAVGATRQNIQTRAAAAKDPTAVAFIVGQTLDKEAKELGTSKETLQKVRNSLDQLRVALLLKDPVLLVDGSRKVQPSAWISAQHHQVRACLVVGDVEETSARTNALDAEIDPRLQGHTSGGQGRAVKRVAAAARPGAWVGSPDV